MRVGFFFYASEEPLAWTQLSFKGSSQSKFRFKETLYLKVTLQSVKILILRKYEVVSVYNLATSSGKDQDPAPVFTSRLYYYNSLHAHPVTFVAFGSFETSRMS